MAQSDDDEIRTVTLSPWAGSKVSGVIGFAIGLALVLIYLMTGGGQSLLHRTAIVRTYMADGTGLVRTAIVELNGIRVGRVKSVTLSHSADPKRAIQVEMRIRRNYLPAIPIDSKTEITADNLMGDKFINIEKGKSPQSVEPGSELATQPPTSNFDPGDLLASLKQILQSANTLLDQVENPATPLGQFVKGEDVYQQFLTTVIGIQNSVQKYGSSKGPIGQAVYGQALYQQMRQYVLDIDKQIVAVQANPMLANTSQYDAWMTQAKAFHESVRSVRDTPMLKDDAAYVNMQATLRNLNDMVNSVSAGPLLTGTELYESLNGSSRDARIFIRDFRLNPQKYLRLKVF